jgi:hypothetical protein
VAPVFSCGLEFWVFKELVEQDDQLAHHGHQGDFGRFTCGIQPPIEHLEARVGKCGGLGQPALPFNGPPRRAMISEHDHYGPYSYLKTVTWHEPLITKDDIQGTQSDIQRLADLIAKRLVTSDAGQIFKIDTEYSQQNEFHLHFEVREDGFDPASADPSLH